MTRDDIIRMAREAGIEVHTRKGQIRIGSAVIAGGDSTFEVVRFAELVAAHEREECAKFLERGVDLKGLAGNPQMQAFCGSLLMGCANAIRARGNDGT